MINRREQEPGPGPHPKPRSRFLSVLSRTAPPLLSAVTVAFAVYTWCDLKDAADEYSEARNRLEQEYGEKLQQFYESNRQYFDDIFAQRKLETPTTDSLAGQLEIRTVASSDNTQFEVRTFNKRGDDLNLMFAEFAKRRDGQESLPTFRQIALEHLFDGLRILNSAKDDRVAEAVVSPDKLQVKLDGHLYDLTDPWQFQMVFALTSFKVNAADFEISLNNPNYADIRKQILKQLAKNELNQESILWLKDQELKTGWVPDGALLLNPNHLANFARALKLVGELGYPTPRFGFFGPHDKYGAIFLGEDQYTSTHTIINYANWGGIINFLVHEVGHDISWLSAKINLAFSQEAFNRLMDQVERTNKPLLKENKNPLDLYAPEGSANKRIEQYANLFSAYLVEGDSLRKKIEYLRAEDPAAANILEAGYNFFKEWSNGQEFDEDILTEKEITARLEILQPKKEAKNYQINQLVSIVDKDSQRPGILLRLSPAASIQVDSPAVFDEDNVRIIEGPLITKRQNWDSQGRPFLEDVRWWRVRIVDQSSESYSLVGNRYGEEGWVQESWFGGIFPSEDR